MMEQSSGIEFEDGVMVESFKPEKRGVA